MTRVVEMGMGQQHAVQPVKLAIGRGIPELLPQTRRSQVVTIKPLQRRQQAYCQRVEQAGAAAGLQVFLVDLLVPLVGKAEVQEQPPLPVLEKDFVAADFVDAAVECQLYRIPPPVAISLTQWRPGGKENEE